MPSKTVHEVLARLMALESKMEQHLVESVEVHTNIAKLQTHTSWMKWMLMGIAGGIGSIIVALAIYALKR